MKLQVITIPILIFFAMVGAVQMGTIFHEYSHMKDFQDYVIEDSDRVCLLEIPTEINRSNFWSFIGYYSFQGKPGSEDAIEEIRKNTEIKAYSYSIFFAGLFLICVFSLFNYLFKLKQDSYILKDLEKKLGVYDESV